MSLCRLARGPLSLHGSVSCSSSSRRTSCATASRKLIAPSHSQRQFASLAVPSFRTTSSDLFPLPSSISLSSSPVAFLVLVKRSHTTKAGPSAGNTSTSLNPSTNMSSAVASSSALKSSTDVRSRKGESSTAGESARSHSTKSGHDHSHDHGIFGHTHSHGGDTEEAAALAAAFSGAGDKGSRIILWGLASNILLTAAKGVGGYMLHSASLLADAGHSLSDLLGDIVVLFSWRLSRRPASRGFQYGYGESSACIVVWPRVGSADRHVASFSSPGKFEALGSLAVATALIGGALGIGALLHAPMVF